MVLERQAGLGFDWRFSGMRLAAVLCLVFPGSMTIVAAQTVQRPDPVTAEGDGGYGSLVTDRVEVRQSPNLDQPVAVVFRRAGMPVKVTAQTAGWHRIEDQDGIGGWVRAELVSRRRTATVRALTGEPSERSVALRTGESVRSDTVALLEPGVVVGIVSCNGQVCRITASGVRGYVNQGALWGVESGEVFR